MMFGVLCVLPNIWQRMDEKYPFAGIEMMGTDQEFYYASRIGQVLEGDWWIADPYYGTKQKNFVQPPLPEWFEGGLGLIFHLDTARTVTLVKLVLGTLLFFVMTLFFAHFTRCRWWSLFAVTAFLCAGFFFSAPQDLFSVISNPNFGGEFLRFSRLTNPLFSSLLFFLTLNAFLSWAQNGSRVGLIFAGILVIAGFIGLLSSLLMRAAGLGLWDRMLGAAFGLARGVVIVVVFVLLGGLTPLPKEPFWREATMSGPLETVVIALRPYLPEGLGERIKYRG